MEWNGWYVGEMEGSGERGGDLEVYRGQYEEQGLAEGCWSVGYLIFSARPTFKIITLCNLATILAVFSTEKTRRQSENRSAVQICAGIMYENGEIDWEFGGKAGIGCSQSSSHFSCGITRRLVLLFWVVIPST